jgi:hypothetical protein
MSPTAVWNSSAIFANAALALGFGALVLLGFLGGFALRLLGRSHFELVDGSGDVADFVLAGEAGKHDVEVAGRHLAHALGQRRDRVGDPACQEESDQAADQQGQRGDDLLDCDRSRDRALGRGARFAEGRLQLNARLLGGRLHRFGLRRDLVDVEIAHLLLVLNIGFRRRGVVHQHGLELPDPGTQRLPTGGAFERRDRFRSLADLARQDRQTFRIERRLDPPVGDRTASNCA